ncbi:MAG: hypothetical protein Fur0012_04630 [Elusimicrobiota bacterium]
MPANKLSAILMFSFAAWALSQEVDISADNSAVFNAEKEIYSGTIEVRTKIRGTPSAYETYDVYAPFDGRIDEVRAELFDLIYPETVLARAVTKDMAALLDTANSADPQSKKQILKRWKGTFEYFDIKPKEAGIVVNIYAKPRDYVKEGDKLFTIARKMQIIAVNTEPVYTPLAQMMKASMTSVRDNGIKVNLYLKSFVPFKEKPFFYRLWMDISELRDRIKIGETFEGELFVGRSENAKLVDRKDVITKDGKRYLLMEIKTGLISDTQLEVLSPTKSFLPPAPKVESKKEAPAQKEQKAEEPKPQQKPQPAAARILKKQIKPAKKPTTKKALPKSQQEDIDGTEN